MLDVHAPYGALQTWKGFFIHIATICIGLLIAIALEQSVETIHRHRELAALRDDLRAESRQILADSRQSEVASLYEEHWLTVRIAQTQAAIRDGRSLAPREPNNRPYSATPDIPIWRSAKAGARTPLLTKGEVNAYAEVEYVQAHVEAFYNVEQATESDLRSFNRMFTVLPNGDTDFTGASSQDLHAYLKLLTTNYEAFDNYIRWLRILIGAELAVIDGKTALEDIYASERKANSYDVQKPM